MQIAIIIILAIILESYLFIDQTFVACTEKKLLYSQKQQNTTANNGTGYS